MPLLDSIIYLRLYTLYDIYHILESRCTTLVCSSSSAEFCEKEQANTEPVYYDNIHKCIKENGSYLGHMFIQISL